MLSSVVSVLLKQGHCPRKNKLNCAKRKITLWGCISIGAYPCITFQGVLDKKTKIRKYKDVTSKCRGGILISKKLRFTCILRA